MPYKDPAAEREADRRYRLRHRAQRNAASHEWYRKNRARAAELTNRWRDTHRDEVNARRRELGRRPEEKVKRQGRVRNRVKDLAYTRAQAVARAGYFLEYRRTHREQIAAKSRRWYSENRERAKITATRRRARLHGLSKHHTREEWRALVALHGDCCAYCGQAKPLARDHVRPLVRGGSDEIRNILPACVICNLRKGTKSFYKFIVAMEFARG